MPERNTEDLSKKLNSVHRDNFKNVRKLTPHDELWLRVVGRQMTAFHKEYEWEAWRKTWL